VQTLLTLIPLPANVQVIGPRHAFAVSKGLEAKLQSHGGTCSSSVVRNKGGAWGWNLTLLVAGEDVDFAGRCS
jgi:hypothetical protein